MVSLTGAQQAQPLIAEIAAVNAAIAAVNTAIAAKSGYFSTMAATFQVPLVTAPGTSATAPGRTQATQLSLAYNMTPVQTANILGIILTSLQTQLAALQIALAAIT